MRVTTKSRVGLVTASSVTLALALSSAAHADQGPVAKDVVGVGSDTVQNIMNFVADGDPFQDPGYNSAGNKYRVVSFDATADANDRAVYGPGGSTTTGITGSAPLPTVILRSGQSPVVRPNGSGDGVKALVGNSSVSFARMSRQPKTTDIPAGNATILHAYRVGKDDLVMAATAPFSQTVNGVTTNYTTNAPAAGFTGTQLYNLYDGKDINGAALPTGQTCATWQNFGGTATTTIIPLIPQTGSGTRSSFLANLDTIAGKTVDPSLPSACVRTVEENDPAAFVSDSGTANGVDKIGPFSSGRKALYDGVTPPGAPAANPGYFQDPASTKPSATGSTPKALGSGIQLLYGTGTTAQTAGACTAPAAGQTIAYCNTRSLYVVLRDADATSTTVWQPGGTQSWATTLFAGTGSYLNSANGQADITAAGATPAYSDCGTVNNTTSSLTC